MGRGGGREIEKNSQAERRKESVPAQATHVGNFEDIFNIIVSDTIRIQSGYMSGWRGFIISSKY